MFSRASRTSVRREKRLERRPHVFAQQSTLGPPIADAWNKVRTRMLTIVQEGQYINKGEFDVLQKYMKQHQRQLGGVGDTQLTFFHLSKWTKIIMREQLAGRVVQDMFAPDSHAARSLKITAHAWAMQPWVTHNSHTFRNPVDVQILARARKNVRARNRHSIIFPACWERGSIVAAAVFAQLKDQWGPGARIHFAYYDPRSTGSKDMKMAMQRAARGGGKKGDPRVSQGPLSKLALATKLEQTGQS